MELMEQTVKMAAMEKTEKMVKMHPNLLKDFSKNTKEKAITDKKVILPT